MADWPGQIVAEDEFSQMPAFAPQEQPVAGDPSSNASGFPGSEVSPPAVAEGIAEPQFVDETSIGFADEAPAEAATQLSPEDTASFYALIRDPKTTAQTLIDFMGARGQSLQNAEDIIRARDSGVPIGDQINYQLPQVGSDGGAGSLARGALDTLTLGTAPKIGAVIGGLERSLAGDGSFAEGYSRVLDNNNAAIAADEAEHPWYRFAGQLLGGLGLPAGLEGVGLRAGTDALRAGATMQEARTAAASAVRNRMGLVGAGYGAAHGAGSADNLRDAAAGAVTEGALGGAAGLGLGAAGQAIAPRLEARVARVAADRQAGREVLEAADRQGITPFAPDVGGSATRRTASAAVQTPLGAGPIVRAANDTLDTAQAARDRIAATIGETLQPEALGETIRTGARSFIARTSQQARKLYGEAEAEAAGARIQPVQALATLDRNITQLSETPGGNAGLARLQTLRNALGSGDFTVQGLRNMRTALADDFRTEGLRGSDIERRVNQVLDATTDDILTGLRAQGRGAAANRYAVADRYWRRRVQVIDDTLSPIIGKDGGRSGEEIARTLNLDLQKNNARSVRLLRALQPEEQATVRASVIGNLGRATSGRQNAEGDAFSLATFLNNWDKIGDSAKAAYFGTEARSALNDLARVAEGAGEAASYANRSNTGGSVFTAATAASGLGGLTTLIPALAGQYATGRLIASPRFARWLARAPKARDPQAYADRLTRIARAEPAIANEVLALQQRIVDAFGSAPTRLAAQEPVDEVDRAQRDAGNQQRQQQGLQP